jgi:hypothetical protein
MSPARLTFSGMNGPMTATEIITALAAADPDSTPVFHVTMRGKARQVTIETAATGGALTRVAEALMGQPAAPPEPG